MKRFLLVFIAVIFTVNAGYCVIDAATGENVKGYKGDLPDVLERFDKMLPKTSSPQFQSIDAFNTSRGYKPVPRDNPTFVNTMIKKAKVSEFVNDINEILPIVEKLVYSIENNENEQLFTARANYLYDDVEFFRKKYADAPEHYYPVYSALIAVSNRAKGIVSIRNEARVYASYLPYQTEGYMYSPQYINEQLSYLKAELLNAIKLMKDVD